VTEQEWLACADPMPMLEFLRGKASERKLRLFACACCRSVWHLLIDARSRHAVEVAERCADEMASDEELQAARAAALGVLVGSERSSSGGDRGRSSGGSRTPIGPSHLILMHSLYTMGKQRILLLGQPMPQQMKQMQQQAEQQIWHRLR
jgi:hypothetical protein